MGLSVSVPERPLIVWHPASTAPDGYIKANGAAISRTAYAWLFGKIGTAFGVGDGSTTFNVPDLRGEFPRGWDDGRGADSGRVFGSAQADELKSHKHQSLYGTTSSTGYTGLFGPGNVQGGPNDVGMSNTGGAETRPRNLAALFCIAIKP